MKNLWAGLVLSGILFTTCAAIPTTQTPVAQAAPTPVQTATASMDALDAAVRETSDYLNKQLPGGNKLVILNIQSDFPALSEYIIDELIANTVNDKVFSVVNRRQLDAIRQELDFQMSGEVDDETAQALGLIAGAQIIVSGAVSRIGDLYRLRVRALSVQSAKIEGQFNRNIPDNATIAALVKSQATGYGGGATYGGTSDGAWSSGQGGSAKPGAGPAPVPAQTQTPAASGTSAMTQTQLYVGTNQNGAMPDMHSALDWISQNAQNGVNYVIVLGKNQAITPTELFYGGKALTLTLKSAGGSHTLTFEGANPSYSLFTVKSGVTLTLEDGITLKGTQNDANKSIVEVSAGKFVMNGGVITGNKTTANGGGVYVKSGIFTMNKGSIRGNTASENYGGGVYVESGTFTMNDGDISGNTASHSDNGSGGGVAVKSGTFTMTGGTISGNTAFGNGHGLGTWGGGGGVYAGGTFTMSGGTISGNTSRGQGGGVQSNKFTMTGGTISGNTATGSGGGVYSDTFTMAGGTISGNTTVNSRGGGVYVNNNGTFIKSGTGNAVIYGFNAPDEQANRARDDSNGYAVFFGNMRSGKKRNTTARAGTAMDSRKDGPAGGWE